jgi:excisionase family DNA binding protein
MAEPKLKKLYRGPEAADALSMSVRSLYREVARGHIPAVRISKRCVRFRQHDLAAYARKFLVRGATK